MTFSAFRFAALVSLVVLTSPRAWANDKADCAAALQAAQADQAAGRLGKALGELATCARPVCPKPAQKRCAELTESVTASQPTVIFTAKDASGNAVTAVTVTVDGVVVAKTLDGAPVPLDPGSHDVKFESDGATTVDKQVAVEPETKGQAVSVDFDVNPPERPLPAVVKHEPSGDGAGAMWDTNEESTKRYYFIGLRYRGDVVPQFLINLFVNGGQTIYSNSIGIEADLRHDHFSLIPAITYTSYGTGNMLFQQKNSDATDPGNWSVVNSSLGAIYLSADLLWSARIAPHWDFEYGAGFGLGFLFGSLEDNWVTPTTGTQVSPTNYTICQTTTQGLGCAPSDHQNATTAKVGGYNEPSWVNGGSKPNLFPLVNFPQLGLRYKPMKQLETRLGVGFSLTGFWFGLSGDYGLETVLK